VKRQGRVLKLLFIAAAADLAAAGTARADASTGAMLSAQLCASCHAIKSGQTSPNAAAPPFAKIAADPSMNIFSLRPYLRTPHWASDKLSLKPDDIDAIDTYIMSLRPRQ
jgi:mono/diheme cytochrome c family protein